LWREQSNDMPSGYVCSNLCAFGYGDGDDYKLSDFRAIADEFKRLWLQKIPRPSVSSGKASAIGVMKAAQQRKAARNAPVLWSDIEAMYWQLVEESSCEVFIRYGSDLDTDMVGSGFPSGSTVEVDRSGVANSSVFSPWNLNILPSVCGSLLKYLPDAICGISIPWLYCGSMFSTFCYHAEDLNMMSINYMHVTDDGKEGGKVWYGAPGGPGAAKFEAAMRTAVPTLFAVQPDLMYELVTMVSPVELQARGAQMCRAIQRQGEFMLTFPQAAHGGFSLGYNVAEAVNFFTPDCFPWMRAAATQCHFNKRNPVFCLTEFIVSLAERLQVHADLSPHDEALIKNELNSIADNEGNRRLEANRRMQGYAQMAEENVGEQGVACCECKQACYLSVMQKVETKELFCLDCVIELVQDQSDKLPIIKDGPIPESMPYQFQYMVDMNDLQSLAGDRV
jgi:[histone H3]-trimethyl-L-lysine4 demethylase